MNIRCFFSILLICVFSFALVAARCGEKPGEGELAKKGYVNAEPIIQALDHYWQENGNYPQILNQLLPKYLSELPRSENNQNYRYFFRQEKQRYELEFTYDAPVLGICRCTYYSDSKSWSCVEMI